MEHWFSKLCCIIRPGPFLTQLKKCREQPRHLSRERVLVKNLPVRNRDWKVDKYFSHSSKNTKEPCDSRNCNQHPVRKCQRHVSALPPLLWLWLNVFKQSTKMQNVSPKQHPDAVDLRFFPTLSRHTHYVVHIPWHCPYLIKQLISNQSSSKHLHIHVPLTCKLQLLACHLHLPSPQLY